MTTPLSLERYRELIEQIRDCIRLHVPPGSVVLIVSKGDEELIRVDGYRAWHFPQTKTAVYAGHHPANSMEAIAHLRQLYSRGAQYLVFPWTARWWLEHYRDLATHLNTVHELTVLQEDVCVIYELRESAVTGYEADVEAIREQVRSALPRDAVVAVVSTGDDELLRLDCRQAWHFPANDEGAYADYLRPADSAEAIDRLEALRARGADFLLLPPSARCWLEHYPEFAQYLESHYRIVVDEDACLIVSLSERAPAPLVSLALPVARPSMRILTILARFGVEQYPHAEEEIREIFKRQMPAVDRTVLTVDNALPRSVVQDRNGAVLLGGDNSAREFSAFDRALDFVGSDIWSYDLVHFATSAFNTLYVAYLDRFNASVLEAISGRAVCVGHVDCYNEPIDVLTYRSQHWIRSCFFLLPPTEAKALGRFVSVVDGRPFFSGSPDEPFRVDAPMSLSYRRYITEWLTGGDIGQGVEWHSSFALTRDMLPAFEQKAVSILNEQLLGIRLRALGCHLIDVTWLSSTLRRKSPLELSWTTSWREQLANREGDALALPRGQRAGMLSTV